VPLAEPIVHTREATVKSTKSPATEATSSGALEATKSAAVKPAAKPPAVEAPAPAPAMRPSVGEIWLAERGSAQQSSYDCQSLSVLRPGFMFA